MVLPILITTLTFVSVALFYNILQNSGSLLNYLILEFQFFGKHLFIVVIVIVGLIIFTVFTNNFHKSGEFLRRIYLLFVRIIQITTLSLLLGYVLLFVIAFCELNIFSVLYNINPAILGVVVDLQSINKTLVANREPPEIITSDTNQDGGIVAIAKSTTGDTNFYGKYILKSVPGFLIIPMSSKYSEALIDNSLIITKLDRVQIQTLSPTLGYLLLKKYFWGRQIKSFPAISAMTQADFIKFRQKDAAVKAKLVSDELVKLDSNISSISAVLDSDSQSLTAAQNTLKQNYKDEDTEYNKCRAVGHYQNGTFIHTNTQADCQYIRDKWEKVINDTNKQIADLSEKIATDKNKKTAYNYYKSFFSAQKQIITIQKINISSELGIFSPPDKIRVVVNFDDSQSVSDYLETMVHEYLHYASYNKNKSLQLSFFEEGLTEYFARNIMVDELDMTTNMGYPLQVKIIDQIAKSIPENVLEDIYFTKDEAGLEQQLNQIYGDDFYKKNAVVFEALQYSSDSKQLLKLANNVMKLIGGNQLVEKDLLSSPSTN